MLEQVSRPILFDGSAAGPEASEGAGALDWEKASELLDKYERRRARRRDEPVGFADVPIEEARVRLIAKLKAIGAIKD